ncbi:flavin-containing monooxygenase [Nocardia carnea]|uniref:Flavin-containing monooxygenase n=1 Tax=Nocardia carnea TaxID=37328 RepID=A0ABW7TRD0_9NOCA|nr:NAD(P)/FAD-dependent oxidoreductase [Nocardia carnea]
MSIEDPNHPAIAVIGSGFSGIGVAISLVRAGFTAVTVYERAGDIGGVWRDNTYPGAACDAPSHLYSYSFAPNPAWSRRFAPQPEILDYLRRCADEYGITEHVRTRTEIVAATFDEHRYRWELTLSSGEIAYADVLISACGQLSRPSYPRLPGTADFAGTAFHSACWDHDFDPAGRDIAVIGNGASAIQFVPHLVEKAHSVTVFQRQPHWISPKPDGEYGPLRRRANKWLPLLQKIPRLAVFCWFEGILNPMLISRRGRRILAAPIRLWCRWNLRRITDPELRRTLLPGYELGCNRILTSNDYYTALDRETTRVVTDPIATVRPTGITTEDGRQFDVDAIVYATGFRSHDFVAPMRVTGLAGENLDTVWKSGARAYLGLTVPGFPNFFLMYGPNTNVGSGSIVHMLESQMKYIVGAVEEISRVRYLDVRPDVLERFDSETRQRLAGTVWNTGGCHSWYVADTAAGPVNTNNWPGSMLGYRRRTRRFDADNYRTVPRPAEPAHNRRT